MSSAAAPRRRGLQVPQGIRRRLSTVGDEAQEAAGRPAVTNPVVEREGELGHLAGHDLAVDDPGTLDDPADTQDRRFRVIDDGGRAIHAEHAVVVDRERAAGQFGGTERAVPGAPGPFGDGHGKLLKGVRLGIAYDGY